MSSIVDRNAGAYTFLAKIPSGTESNYDNTMKDLDIVTNPPKGLMLHSAGILNGVCVIDLWRSESEWKTFLDSRLMSIGSKYGIVPIQKLLPEGFGPLGGSLMLFLLVGILGWRVFGAPLQA